MKKRARVAHALRELAELGAVFLRTESELILKSRQVVPGGWQRRVFHWSIAINGRRRRRNWWDGGGLNGLMSSGCLSDWLKTLNE